MFTTTDKSTYAVVEEPSLEPVLDELAAIHGETRGKPADVGRFRWLYQSNPDGEAIVWTLRKEATDEIVGFTACLPRRIWVNRGERICWIGSDFSIRKQYRSLGLAMKLRRAAKEAIDAGRCEFLYAHPNDRMAVIHQQVGHFRAGQMARYARLLSTRPLVEERVASKVLAAALAKAADPLLTAAGPEWRTRRSAQDAHHAHAVFGAEFDDLFERHRDRYQLLGVRDSRYLNWRYARHPLQNAQLLTLKDGENLLAYLVFTVDPAGPCAAVQDLFPAHDERYVGELLSGLARLGRRERWRSASFTLLETHPLVPLLRRWRYRRRPETSQMFAYAPGNSDLIAAMSAPASWYVTEGDRDV